MIQMNYQVLRNAALRLVIFLSFLIGGGALQSAETANEFCVRLRDEMKAGTFTGLYQAFDLSEFTRRVKQGSGVPEDQDILEAIEQSCEEFQDQIDDESFFDELLVGTLFECLGVENDEDGAKQALFRFVPPDGVLAYALLKLEAGPRNEWRITDIYLQVDSGWLSEIYAAEFTWRAFHEQGKLPPLWLALNNKALVQASKQEYDSFFRTYSLLLTKKKVIPEVRSRYFRILADEDPGRLREEFDAEDAPGPQWVPFVTLFEAIKSEDFESAEYWLASLKEVTFQDPFLAYFDLLIAFLTKEWNEAVDAGAILMKEVPEFRDTQLASMQCFALANLGQYAKLIDVLEFYVPDGSAEFLVQLQNSGRQFDSFFRDAKGREWLVEEGISIEEIDALSTGESLAGAPAGMTRDDSGHASSVPEVAVDSDVTEEELGEMIARINAFKDEGNYAEATQLAEVCLKLAKLNFGEIHELTANAMKTLADSYRLQDRAEKAAPLYERCAAIIEVLYGEFSWNTGVIFGDVGKFYVGLGNVKYAEPYLSRAYKTSLFVEEGTLDEAYFLDYGLHLNFAKEDYQEAEKLSLRILEIYKEHAGEESLEVARALEGLGAVFEALEEFEEAEAAYRQSLAIMERTLCADHPGVAMAASRLASLLKFSGNFDESESLYKMALNTRERKLGEDHSDTASSLNGLSELYLMQERHEDAKPLVQRYLENKHRYMTRVLRYFPERDCQAMQRKLKTTNASGFSANGLLAAKEQIWFKGAVVEALSRRKAAEVQLSKSDLGEELLGERREWLDKVRSSVLTTGNDSGESAELQEQLGKLESRINSLLTRSSDLSIGEVDLSDVQGVLQEDETLVEMFLYKHRVENREQEPRYAGVAIQKTGEPVYVELGAADEIEEAIASYREVLKGAQEDLSQVEKAKALRSVEATLYGLLLKPLLSQVETGGKVIFSLDSKLHFLPLGMLRDAEGVPFGQNYRTRYVASGRDLLTTVTPEDGENKSAFILGNPAFRDNAPLRALATVEDDKVAGRTGSRSAASADGVSINLTPLPGTAQEIRRVSERLDEKGFEITRLSREEATEETVRTSIEGHNIVHLATHGFFLNEIEFEQEMEGFDGDVWVSRYEISDPMYRSGLALTGAQSTFNLWKNGKMPPDSSDGVFMAAEANLLDLRGTDLVVLSACETASGEALSGAGVMGLRRAFASAGANNTIMTLWAVNDKSTVEVMDAFYEKYLSGTHPAIALAEVQNELYEPFVEKYGEVDAIRHLASFVCMSLGMVE